MNRSAWIWLIVSGILTAGGPRLLAADLKYPFAESSLGGVVMSQKGDVLEGILVRARKEKLPIAHTVATDAQGQYRFPKLEPGRYEVEIARADGLEPSQQVVEIQNGREAKVNFTLGPAKEMEKQITSVDWLRNLPGTPEQIQLLSDSCMHCHTGTLLKFRFDKEGWLKIARIMRSGGREPIPGGRPAQQVPGWDEKNQIIAELLSKVRGPQPIDLSNAKILPRPTGRSTRVMYTEYNIPYPNAELHDVDVDRFGMVWWTDWRWPYMGMLNPETGEMKYWETPALDKPEERSGNQEIGFDKDENPWTVAIWTGGLIKFDRKTEKFSVYTFPDQAQRHFVALTPDTKRNRIWFQMDNYYGRYYAGYFVEDKRQWTIYENPFKPGKISSGMYGGVTDSKGNHYMMKNRDSDIDRIDAETGELTRYSTPTPNAFPRRGDYDSQDRIWFAEYNAGQIGMFDPTAKKITEYKIDLPLALPYGMGVDRNTDLVWVELYRADRLNMLDPKTSAMRQYLLPERHVMSRAPRFAPTSTADHSVLFLGTLPKYGNGKIIKVETW